MIECVICNTVVEEKDLTKYAVYGGLPSPCCKICFEVHDYRIKEIGELKIKSLMCRFGDKEKEEKS